MSALRFRSFPKPLFFAFFALIAALFILSVGIFALSTKSSKTNQTPRPTITLPNKSTKSISMQELDILESNINKMLTSSQKKQEEIDTIFASVNSLENFSEVDVNLSGRIIAEINKRIRFLTNAQKELIDSKYLQSHQKKAVGDRLEKVLSDNTGLALRIDKEVNPQNIAGLARTVSNSFPVYIMTLKQLMLISYSGTLFDLIQTSLAFSGHLTIALSDIKIAEADISPFESERNDRNNALQASQIKINQALGKMLKLSAVNMKSAESDEQDAFILLKDAFKDISDAQTKAKNMSAQIK